VAWISRILEDSRDTASSRKETPYVTAVRLPYKSGLCVFYPFQRILRFVTSLS